MTHTFSIRESFRFGWHTLKAHSTLIYKVLLTLLALQVAQAVVGRVLEGTALGMLANLVLTIAGIVLGAGVTLVSLRLAKGEHAQYQDIVPPTKTVLYFFVASVVSGFITMLPILIALCVIAWQIISTIGFEQFAIVMQLLSDPRTTEAYFGLLVMQISPLAIVFGVVCVAVSIYLAILFLFVKLAILEKLDIMASLRKSIAMTRGIKGKLFLCLLALIAINIAGAALLLIGLLVSIPVSMLAFARVYTHLEHR